jgi:carbon storage regulator
MLVLARKIGDKILIGDHITTTVVEIRGGTVRLGIEAPVEVPILRDNAKDVTPKHDKRKEI